MLTASTRRRLLNEQIFVTPISVFDKAGRFLGEFRTVDAISMAKARANDLVLFTSRPPSAMLADPCESKSSRLDPLEAFSFDPSARVKKMQFGLNVGVGDFERKIEELRGFLQRGWRCEVLLEFGRRASDTPLKIVGRILAEIRDVAKPLITNPKCLSRDQRITIWPCSRQQASRFFPPTIPTGSESSEIAIDEIKRTETWRRQKDPKYYYKKRVNENDMV